MNLQPFFFLYFKIIIVNWFQEINEIEVVKRTKKRINVSILNKVGIQIGTIVSSCTQPNSKMHIASPLHKNRNSGVVIYSGPSRRKQQPPASVVHKIGTNGGNTSVPAHKSDVKVNVMMSIHL